MKAEKSKSGRRLSLRPSDKVILAVVALLGVLIAALGILQRCGFMPINGALTVFLPLLLLAVLVGWGIFVLVRRIKRRLVKVLVGGGLAVLLLLALTVVVTYVSYMSFYITPQKYATIVSPSGTHRLVVMRAFDTDEGRREQRKAARLAAVSEVGGEKATDGTAPEETVLEDWGFIYRAYPQALGMFYRSNAAVEGEIYLSISDFLASAEASQDGAARDDASASAEAPVMGTLMVEWQDDENTAHFFVENPGVAEGGECYVRF